MLFVYVYDIVKNAVECIIPLSIRIICVSKHLCMVLYADYVVFFAPTVTTLQRLLKVCEIELVNLDMQNVVIDQTKIL